MSEGQVAAQAEQVSETEGPEQGDNKANTDEIDVMVRQAALHLTAQERRQLEATLRTSWHLLVTGKGDLGQTNIVQHQINTSDHPAIKQHVHQYQVLRH